MVVGEVGGKVLFKDGVLVVHVDCEYEVYGVNANVYWFRDSRSSLYATKIEQPKQTLTVNLRLNEQKELETIDGSVIKVSQPSQLAQLQKDHIYKMLVKLDIVENGGIHDNDDVVMGEGDSEVDIVIYDV